MRGRPLLTICRIVSFRRISAGKSAAVQKGLFADVMFRCKNAIASWLATPAKHPGSAQEDFASGITPPSAAVSSAATSQTIRPSSGKRSSVTREVMPDTEIAASGSLQSL